MAHFPPSFLDEVLARTDIVELIGRHVQLKKSGSNYMGLCPFHHEKTPSFSVSADKQLYYCFGCGKGGGAFQFLMEHDGYSFPEAVEYLAEKAGLEIPREAAEKPGEEARRRQGLALLDRAARAFEQALGAPEGQAARDYFRQRGLDARIIRDWRLGFAPPGYGFMQRVFGGDGRTLAQLEAVGLMFRGERGYADRFRGRVMFPIRDRRGQVVGFGGRLMGPGEPKYLNSPETPWFHKASLLYGLFEHRDEIRKRKQLLVVEGYMDVLACNAHGLPVAVAPLGTAIGERQIREILRLHPEPVFCFDGDRAGRQAAWRALERMLPVLAAEHGPRFLYLPEGEDPDSLLAREGAEAFARRMEEQARPVLETWLAGLANLAGRGPEGRARMAKKADTMLAAMGDDYLRQVWRQEAERATGVRLRAGGAAAPAPAAAPGPVAAAAPGRAMEEKFLAALVFRPERFARLPEGGREILLDDPMLHRLYTRALELAGSHAAADAGLAAALEVEFPQADVLPRWANEQDVSDEDFADLLLAMEARSIERRLRQGGLSLPEQMRLKRRHQEIQQQRRRG